jgi:menaquinone-specific isochorismate synthase
LKSNVNFIGIGDMQTFEMPKLMTIENRHVPLTTVRARGRLLSYSRPVADVSLLSFLQNAPDEQRVYWENRRTDLAFAGYGAAAELFANGKDRFETIQDEIAGLFDRADIDNPDGVLPRLFGGFSFRPDFDPQGVWLAFPSAYFMLPRYLLTRADGELWLTVNQVVGRHESTRQAWHAVYDEFEQISEQLTRLPMQPYAEDTAIQSIEYPLERDDWRAQIINATREIRRGALDKVVLSRISEIAFDRPLDPVNPLARLEAKYPDTYRFLIEPLRGHSFFGATPELLAEVNGRMLKTGALAGSIGRGDTPQVDDVLAQQLMDTPKERHEHDLVVTALRESLQPATAHLEIDNAPQILRLSNIQHLYTPVRGQLRADYGLLDIVERLHPTPALGGYPRREALEAVKRIETVERGWYASPVGWIDYHGDGMFAVAIRSAVRAGQTARLYAGAGIVADSDPDKEWAETGLKFRPMLAALGALGADIHAGRQS